MRGEMRKFRYGDGSGRAVPMLCYATRSCDV